MTRMAECHPEKENKSGGLCGACYQRNTRRKNGVPERVLLSKNAVCHPELKNHGKGLCSSCYDTAGFRPRAWRCHPERAMKYGGFCSNCAAMYNWNRWRFRAIQMLGGKCAKCGNDDTYILHVDHIGNDGVTERTFTKNGIMGRSHDFLRKMVNGKISTDGLQVLCPNCHEDKTKTNRWLWDLSVQSVMEEEVDRIT